MSGCVQSAALKSPRGSVSIGGVSAEIEVPVLIVGGGPVGLSTAIGLRRLGIDCTLVERHRSTLDFPKGRRVEIFRQWGLEQAVTAVALPREESPFHLHGRDAPRRGLSPRREPALA
jgi:2-polyprenyl-6-methoxyphenol hydroxylase-like FAD-dependent oxidoreductase